MLRLLRVVSLFLALGQAVPAAAAQNYQDMWWLPAESGWGLMVLHQADVISAVLFHYNAEGKPVSLDSLKGNYGCAGPLPGAPGGANLVSAGPVGAPVFATTESPAYADAGAVRPLPPNTRLTYRQVGCGVDDAGVVACLNSREQVGFVVGPNGTYIGNNNPPPPPESVPGAPVPPPG